MSTTRTPRGSGHYGAAVVMFGTALLTVIPALILYLGAGYEWALLLPLPALLGGVVHPASPPTPKLTTTPQVINPITCKVGAPFNFVRPPPWGDPASVGTLRLRMPL
jgi:hypothetical protein